VASRPERLEKDLANAKILVAQLEDEAAKFRGMKISELNVKPKVNGEPKPEEDAAMAPPEEMFEEEQEMEPRERGSEAVERRIEKIMADLREQGLVDVNNETEYEEKKVCLFISLRCALTYEPQIADGGLARFVSCVPSCSIPRMLLLRCNNRSS
jgi:chromosome segregation ATPase